MTLQLGERDDMTGFDPAYPIDVFLRSARLPEANALGKALAARLGPVRRGEDGPDGALRFILDNPRFSSTGATSKPTLAFSMSEGWDQGAVRDALAQSFDVDNGTARLAACGGVLSMVAVSDPHLTNRARRVMVAAALMALLERVRAELIYWPQSGQLLDPAKLRAKFSEPGQRSNPSYGFVNVRLFTPPESETQIMDTLGLESLGLTDLQIRFQGLDRADVADLLYSVAAYLLENGDVIDNGHTVPGLLPGESWTCMHAMSIVEPDRLVLELDPGVAHRPPAES